MDFITLNRSGKTKTLRVLIRACICERADACGKRKKEKERERMDSSLGCEPGKDKEKTKPLNVKVQYKFRVVFTRHTRITVDHEIRHSLISVYVYVHLLMLR